MKTLIKILCLSVLWFSCESATEPQDVHGCLDSQACNYNPNANIDNNSCIYLADKIEQGYCNCDDEVFDENGEMTEHGHNKLKELQKKWCLENQKDNYK